MREPFLDEEAPTQTKAKKGASKGAARKAGTRRAAKGKPLRPYLPRVPGGKALARLHFFEGQREIEETDVQRKTPDKCSTKLSDGDGSPATHPGTRATARSSARTLASRGAQTDAVSPYLKAFAEKEHLDITAPAAPVEQGWRPLGPFSIPHGQTYGRGAGSRPPVAGRIVAVAVDPGNANHILIGAAGGGVWETKDGGQNWQPRTDDQPSLSIGAVAFNPGNPLIVYAGTGEGDSVSALGVGILRSTDGGTTWSLHARAPFEGIGFYDLVVDPLNGIGLSHFMTEAM